ncbi:hypothetical protein RJ641_025504 [Dillenia turbinata]|uniref:Uncharacterized protein n=1 Tax=Dillenia turbinata TaxID=194707 RepID=A0AAN8ZP06_9MAGN
MALGTTSLTQPRVQNTIQRAGGGRTILRPKTQELCMNSRSVIEGVMFDVGPKFDFLETVFLGDLVNFLCPDVLLKILKES